ncbi:MAG: hypothetical protein J6K32_08195 [Clostridia bacterium]|nr:hypothetical protein [Clostridia bacterium]
MRIAREKRESWVLRYCAPEDMRTVPTPINEDNPALINKRMGLYEDVCETCGASFVRQHGHAYWRYRSSGTGAKAQFCSWGCMRKWDAEAEKKKSGKTRRKTLAQKIEYKRMRIPQEEARLAATQKGTPAYRTRQNQLSRLRRELHELIEQAGTPGGGN